MSPSTGSVDTGWLASAGGFTGAAWFAPAPARHGGSAVLIVPGIAHEERTMADGLVALARSLAGAGHGALLIDLHGTAQSSGQLDTPDIGERWRTDVRSALAHLRGAAFGSVIVVGVRLGALIAFDALKGETVDGFVAWAPVANGRRYVRELRMLQGASVDAPAAKGQPVAVAGHTIPAPVLAHLSTLELDRLAARAPLPTLLLDQAEQLDAPWCEAFAQAGHTLDRRAAVSLERWLFSPDQMPALPLADIAAVTAWCDATAPVPAMPQAPKPLALLHQIVLTDANGRRVRERTVRIEPQGLSAIVSEPAQGCAHGATRLLATMVGPGRLFPEFARAEAARGKACLRFDFAGFSTSRLRADGSGGSLYGPENRIDVAAVLAALRRAGHGRVVTIGFCAGAWSMVHAGSAPGVVGFVGINVALYRQPDYRWRDHLHLAGHPVSKLLSLLRRAERLESLIDRLERKSSLLLSPARWLLRLCRSKVRVLLVFGASDLGLAYVTHRMGARLASLPRAARPQIERYEGLGHLTEGAGARAHALADVTAFLEEIDDAPEPLPRAATRPAWRSLRDWLEPFAEPATGSLSRY